MNKFKLNCIEKVVQQNRDVIFPKIGNREAQESIRSIAFTPEHLKKLEKLRSKYKISKSAIIRILLDFAD